MTTFAERISDLGQFSFQRVRRNHALEHATLQVLSRKRPELTLAGYSDYKGFWVVGEIAIDELRDGVDEALRRLQAGESELAIHPNCGTNFVTSGLLAGTAAYVGMLGTGSERRKSDRFPIMLLMVMGGLILAQPLGPILQHKVTTSADVEGMRVREISRQQRGNVPLHRVLTAG